MESKTTDELRNIYFNKLAEIRTLANSILVATNFDREAAIAQIDGDLSKLRRAINEILEVFEVIDGREW